MATQAKDTDSDTGLSKEEKAFLVNALWTALQAPQWTKDDLIELGKAIFSRLTLQKMPDKTFDKVFPFLTKISESLGVQLADQADKLSKMNGSGEDEEAGEEEEKEEEKPAVEAKK